MLGKGHEFAVPALIVMDVFKCVVHSEFPEKRLYQCVRETGVETMKRLWQQDPDFVKLAASVRRQVMRDRSREPEWLMPVPLADKNPSADEMVLWLHRILVWYIDNGHETPAGFEVKQKIWLQAFQSGSLKTVVYSDALSCIKRWHEKHIRLVLFSEVHKSFQTLLMKHTTAGDLTPMFEGFHDLQSLGEDASHDRIVADHFKKLADLMYIPVDQILYLSGSPQAVKSAKEAGATSILVVGHPNQQFHALGPQKIVQLERIRSFNELKWKDQRTDVESASKSSSSSTDKNSENSKSMSTKTQAVEKGKSGSRVTAGVGV